MKEKQLQAMFRNWLKQNWRQSAAFELKICKTDRFNLKCIAPHQIANLEMANQGLFFFKIQDLGMQCPFDCFTLYQVEADIVLFFYKPRQPKIFYMLSINIIQGLIEQGYKSITEEDAKKLAFRVGELKT